MTRPRSTHLVLLCAAFALACEDGVLPTTPPNAAGDPAYGPAFDLASEALHAPLASSIEEFLALGRGPIAIAHRGMGANRGEDPDRPIENTVEAVRDGYETGASIVEVDLQITADGEVVAWHDDFLEDHTCFNTLTRDQLAERAPHIPSFQAVLQTARRYNSQNPDRLTGLLTVDLKPASPLCDPEDVAGAEFVSSVIRIVRRMDATDLIYFNSMSPVILDLAAAQAPEIPRQLTVLVLQLLSPEEVEAALGLPVSIIEKDPDFGLTWAEIGVIHRLPGYASPQQAIATAFATGSRIVSWDLRLLGMLEQTQRGAGAQLVRATQEAGLHVFSGDVSAPEHWFLGASLGVEALYADDVPLGVSLQPALN